MQPSAQSKAVSAEQAEMCAATACKLSAAAEIRASLPPLAATQGPSPATACPLLHSRAATAASADLLGKAQAVVPGRKAPGG